VHSWCDKLASTPTVGFTLTPHYAPFDTVLNRLSPILDRNFHKVEIGAEDGDGVGRTLHAGTTQQGARHIYERAKAPADRADDRQQPASGNGRRTRTHGRSCIRDDAEPASVMRPFEIGGGKFGLPAVNSHRRRRAGQRRSARS
jgi:hypothetical protein